MLDLAGGLVLTSWSAHVSGPCISRSPVHGVVHSINQKELAALDASEEPLYHRVQMPVHVSTPHGTEEAPDALQQFRETCASSHTQTPEIVVP